MGYKLYRIREKVVFIHVPQEGYIINFNPTPAKHYYTEDYFDRAIFCTLCQAGKQGNGITADNIVRAIKDFFTPFPTLTEVRNWLDLYSPDSPHPDNPLYLVVSQITDDPGTTVTFFPHAPVKPLTPGNLQEDGNLDVFKNSWGGQILPPNPLPYKTCCF
ncbi:MAG: hypothetical protein QME75_15720 [Deltaproteobacteria bacterium]|nr:hypothetical protein [Deltaproteobacteria bacterium]